MAIYIYFMCFVILLQYSIAFSSVSQQIAQVIVLPTNALLTASIASANSWLCTARGTYIQRAFRIAHY